MKKDRSAENVYTVSSCLIKTRTNSTSHVFSAKPQRTKRLHPLPPPTSPPQRLSALQTKKENKGGMFAPSPHHRHHQFLNREGRRGTRGDFTTSFLHFSLFSAALLDLANSRHVHSLMLSSHLFLCLFCLLPPFTVPCKMVLARPDEQET